ncbi:MAG: type I DNA topoisomerase, partial [bacterium]
MNKVESQKARRILDRLVGYLVSPFLWKVYYKGLSAGRVQTVALRLIVEREEEIEKFVSKKYWNIYGEFILPNGKTIRAKLVKIDGKPVKIESETELSNIIGRLRKVRFSFKGTSQKEQKIPPQPPYITSTLQLEANQRLNFSAIKTMTIAQRLYEGVELGAEGPVGLITYMRTDSPRLAPEAIATAQKYIVENFGENYSKPRNFKSKSSIAQEAHEAIRPTFIEYTPGKISKYLSQDELKLYDFIWRKFVASQMEEGVVRIKKAIIEGNGFSFEATEKRIVFDGWLKVFPVKNVEEGEEIPELLENTSIEAKEFESKEEETKPPPRFTEGSLVKELESKGIGRPSTYAPIIQTLLQRKYIERKKGVLHPTELGRNIARLLVKLFSEIFEVGFTAKMEDSLDKLEQ